MIFNFLGGELHVSTSTSCIEINWYFLLMFHPMAVEKVL